MPMRLLGRTLRMLAEQGLLVSFEDLVFFFFTPMAAALALALLRNRILCNPPGPK